VLQEKAADAASVYEKLIEKDKDSDILYFNLGIIYSKMGKVDEAISALGEAVKLNPRYLEACMGLGVLYETKNDLASAVKHYDKALEIDPTNVNVYHRLGFVLTKDKRYSEAAAVYETLAKIDAKDPFVYIEWANIFFNQKLADEAIGILEKGIAAGIKDADLYTALGYARSLKNETGADVFVLYNMALEIKPDSAVAHFYLGAYYDRIKNKDAAARQMREAIRLNPEYHDAYNYLSYMFSEEGLNLDEAVELAKKALEYEPENGAYLDSLGWAYFKKGSFDEALVEVERAAVVMPDDATIAEHLGDIYSAKGLIDKARAAWKRSLELDPKQEKVREKLKGL
jgi:tetratricopeptide (TPR) repeat protein